MSFDLVKLNSEDFDTIKTLVEKADDVKLDYSTSAAGNSIRLYSQEEETSLYFKVNFKSLIISNVILRNKRKGTMSCVLEEIKLLCHKYNVNEILVESVTTIEMYEFCLKHNFVKRDLYPSLSDEGNFRGDYVLEVK